MLPQQNAPADCKAKQAQRVERRIEDLVDEAKQRRSRCNRQRQQQRTHTDARFQNGVDLERLPKSVQEPAAEKAPQRQPTHEGAENGRDREDRVADHKRQQLHPQHFIDQPARPGKQQQGQDPSSCALRPSHVSAATGAG